MASLRARWRKFRKDDRASLAVMGATLLPLIIGCAALGLDLANIFIDRRHVQSAADIAAMIAANNISVASNAATAAAVQNKFPTTAVTGVELGVYSANAAISPSARFVASGSTGANAVRVTMKTATPLNFMQFFTGNDHVDQSASATAARTAMASFAIGSRTAGLNGGLLNSLLSQMLGGNISLSVSDYNSLLNTQIDLFDFFSQLATRVNLTAVTYDSLLNANVKLGDLIVSLQKANGSSLITPIVNSLVSTLGTLTTQTALAPIASLGPYVALLVGQKPQTSVSVSALDLLSAIAMAANGTNQIPASINLGLPGIASASVNIAIGQQPQSGIWMATGLPGVSAKTAQTRISISLALVGTPPASVVNVPIYIEVARGTATLSSVSCGYPNVSASSIGMAVTPGIVDAWIGSPNASDFANLGTPVIPNAGTLVNLGLITVTGRAHASIGNTTPTNVSFNYSDITSHAKKTVTSTNFTSSLVSSLLGNLTLTVNVGPLGLPIPGLGATVAGILAGATTSIDQLLVTVLTALGVGIGQADVWVNGIRCDGAVLVN